MSETPQTKHISLPEFLGALEYEPEIFSLEDWKAQLRVLKKLTVCLDLFKETGFDYGQIDCHVGYCYPGYSNSISLNADTSLTMQRSGRGFCYITPNDLRFVIEELEKFIENNTFIEVL